MDVVPQWVTCGYKGEIGLTAQAVLRNSYYLQPQGIHSCATTVVRMWRNLYTYPMGNAIYMRRLPETVCFSSYGGEHAAEGIHIHSGEALELRYLVV